MTMHAGEHRRESPGGPKIVIDERIEASGGPRASEAQIRILQQEATDPKELMICSAALESPNDGVREVALAACAELWEQRRVRLRARRQEPQLVKLELYREDDDPDEPSEEELRVGDLTGVLEILASTPVGPRKATGTPLGTMVAHARLVEFPCPLCHRPVVGYEDRGILRVPRHQIAVPVFPFGFAMPAHLIRCPASGSPITECCDKEHAGTPCGDPRCWQLPDDQPQPFFDDVAATEGATTSLAPPGCPSRPPGCVTSDAAPDDDGDFGDGGELDGTVVDADIPSDGWQPEPTVMAAEAFRDVDGPASDDSPEGDFSLAVERFARGLR